MKKYEYKAAVEKDAYYYRDTSVSPGNFARGHWVLKEWDESYGSSNGITTLSYKVGVSNHVWWSAFSGAGIGAGIAKEIVNDRQSWQYVYFDQNTGEYLSRSNKNDAASKLNDKGITLLGSGNFSEAKEYFNNAYINSSNKTDYDKFANSRDATALAIEAQTLLNSGKFSEAKDKFQAAYSLSIVSKFSNCKEAANIAAEAQRLLNEGKFSEAQIKFHDAYNKETGNKQAYADARHSAAIASEAQNLLKDGKFSEAATRFQKAANESTASEIKNTILNYKEATDLAAEAQTFFDNGNYSGAVTKFGAAYDKSNVYEVYSKFSNYKTKAQTEVDALALNSQGNTFFNQGNYVAAATKYQEAYSKSQISKEYSKYSTNKTKADKAAADKVAADKVAADKVAADKVAREEVARKTEEARQKAAEEARKVTAEKAAREEAARKVEEARQKAAEEVRKVAEKAAKEEAVREAKEAKKLAEKEAEDELVAIAKKIHQEGLEMFRNANALKDLDQALEQYEQVANKYDEAATKKNLDIILDSLLSLAAKCIEREGLDEAGTAINVGQRHFHSESANVAFSHLREVLDNFSEEVHEDYYAIAKSLVGQESEAQFCSEVI